MTHSLIVCIALLASSPSLPQLHERSAKWMERLPEREPQSGKDMPTKLGLLYIMGETESQGMLDLADTGHVPIIKTNSYATDRSKRVVDANPGAIWIVSGDGKIDATTQTPQQAADVLYASAEADMARVPAAWHDRVDYLEITPCMWEPRDATQARWYSEMMLELLPRVAKLGVRPIVLNSSVGRLPIEPEVLDGMAPGLLLAHHLGGAWGCHGYTLKYTTDIEIELYHSLRYRMAYAYFAERWPELLDFSMILLEGGVDDAGDPDTDGWLARGSLEQFTDWLVWYDKQMMRDDYVLGVTLFKIGAPSIWKSFEMEPVVPWLRSYYERAYEER